MLRHGEQQIERHTERETAHRQARPQGFGRILRILVGEPLPGAVGGASGPVDASAGHPAGGAEVAEVATDGVEFRLRHLEHGVRLLAETLRRSHAELSAGVRTLQGAAAADGVTRDEVRAMLGEALGPLSVSVDRLAQSVHGLPLVLSASNERLLDRAVHPTEPELGPPVEPPVFIPEALEIAQAEDAQPRLTSEDWSDGAWVNGLWVAGPRGKGDDFPARPFDEAPDGLDGNGEWFWNERGTGSGDPGGTEP